MLFTPAGDRGYRYGRLRCWTPPRRGICSAPESDRLSLERGRGRTQEQGGGCLHLNWYVEDVVQQGDSFRPAFDQERGRHQ